MLLVAVVTLWYLVCGGAITRIVMDRDEYPSSVGVLITLFWLPVLMVTSPFVLFRSY